MNDSKQEWWTDPSNLLTVIEWLDPTEVRDVLPILEKPWNWTDEYDCAQAVLDHRIATTEIRQVRSGRSEVAEHRVVEVEDSDGIAAKCGNCDWTFGVAYLEAVQS